MKIKARVEMTVEKREKGLFTSQNLVNLRQQTLNIMLTFFSFHQTYYSTSHAHLQSVILSLQSDIWHGFLLPSLLPLPPLSPSLLPSLSLHHPNVVRLCGSVGFCLCCCIGAWNDLLAAFSLCLSLFMFHHSFFLVFSVSLSRWCSKWFRSNFPNQLILLWGETLCNLTASATFHVSFQVK